MINLEDEDIIIAINDLTNRESKRGLRKLIKLEIAKLDKLENRILVLCEFRFYFISINKNNKPGKIENFFHFLDIKKLESLSNNLLIVQTHDNKEYKIHTFESSESSTDFEITLDSLLTNIDEVLVYYATNLFDVFPSITIKDLIENVNIQPEKRLQMIYYEINDLKSLKNSLNICDSYAKAYAIYSDISSANFYHEVVWDVNFIYGKNSLNEFCLNDFEYVNQRDLYPVISALKHNKWFESFYSEGIKLSNEMQEELIKVLILPNCNIKKLSLIQSSLKQDFLNKLQTSLQLIKSSRFSNQQNLAFSNAITNLESINLSKNPIEDRGLAIFTNLFKDQQSSSTHSNLTEICLSKCSISSKGINNMFSTINLYLLKCLDLSYNNLKEEPVDFLKYLSEPNQLTELNLSSTDLDMDKLFQAFSRGGCDINLKKLYLNSNHMFSKLTSNENLIKFLLNTKSLVHLELSNCKLSPSLIQAVLSSLKFNQSLKYGLHLNLSSNDIGNNFKQFMFEFNSNIVLTSIDLSDNNLDIDSDLLISQLQASNIKSLNLSRNFQYSKSKHITRLIQSLVKWLLSKQTSLEYLWLIDCRLKQSLNDLISELGEFTKLKFLDISGNDIGDFGFNLLSKSLQVNRSLETLIFDKSSVSLNSYQNIIESLKRNFTLKTIQMPINDICILYQKSPDKVIDIVKQMTESLSQRNLLNLKQKQDLNQLFRTKMKLINDSPHLENRLNQSLGSISSNNSSSSINTSPNKRTIETENELEVDSNYPSSVKEVLQLLNESACSYLNNNAVESKFKNLNQEYFNKLDDFVLDLENNLLDKLKKTYPKLNKSLEHNQNSLINSPELTKLKQNLKEYMNSMLVQIHNEVCQMTYNTSLSLSEKLMSETAYLNSKPITTNTNKPSTTETDSNLGLANKKIIGGIRLPFVVSFQNQTSVEKTGLNEAQSTGPRSTDFSKSKRPISSQMLNDLSPSNTTTQTSLINEFSSIQARSVSPVKHLSSSSNENLIENSSDDELDVSQEKIIDSINQNKLIDQPVPVPAPRKTKNIVKSFLSGFGVGSAQLNQKFNPTSPKINRKLPEEPVKEIEEQKKTEEAKPLEHMNKNRARRPNVKRPTVKNPQSKIEVELAPEILNNNETESTKPNEENQLSPLLPAKALNQQIEQPKVSLNALENVKLRKTIRYNKPAVEEEKAQAQAGQMSKLGNRFSMFENPLQTKSKPKNDLNEINESSEEQDTVKTTPTINKPLPPVPLKPPRPAFNPTNTGKSDPNQISSMLGKLRPISNINNSSTNTCNKTNLITNENSAPVGIKLTNVVNNSSSSSSTSTTSISSNSASSVSESKEDKDKRSSVKEIVQMLSEESKA